VLPNPSRKRIGRLRILVLDEAIPFPPNAGKPARTWNLLRRLARRHSICLLCYGNADSPAALAVRNVGIRLCLVKPKPDRKGLSLYLRLFFNLFSSLPFSVVKHYSRRFQKALHRLLQERWDLIQCEWTPYAQFIRRAGPVPTLIATHNVESHILARRAGNVSHPVARTFFLMQQQKMRRFEQRVLRRASAVTAVTGPEVKTMSDWGVRPLAVIPNGADLASLSSNFGAERNGELLFLASLDWYPNVDALTYFIQEVFPIVRTRWPDVRLRIVGRKPSKILKGQFSGLPGIDFVGEVEDVRSYLASAAVIVVPLRIGAGSRIKILEALAAGKAVVSSSVGAEGLEVISGTHLLIADSPEDFALAIDQFLASEGLRRRLGARGKELVRDRYGWEKIASRLESVWYEVVNGCKADPAVFGSGEIRFHESKSCPSFARE